MPKAFGGWGGNAHAIPQKPRQGLQGFTLLELLVAISIFAVISLGSYQMLQSLMASHDKVRDQARFYADLNLALAIMGRDFKQFTARPVRDVFGEPQEALTLGGAYLAEFTRTGWRNPGGKPRSALQRVAYSLDYRTGTLTRHFWLALDRAEDSEPINQPLLTEVRDLTITPWTADPAQATPEAWPLQALEVALTTRRLGEITRIYPLAAPSQPLASQTLDDTDG